jgi:dCMP deaminase
MPEQEIILAYLPVLHEGYRQFLARHPSAQHLYILGDELIAEFDHLVRKDIRALPPELIVQALQAWSLPFPVSMAQPIDLEKLNTSDTQIVAPLEDEIKNIVEKYLPQAHISYDTFFLRWDASRSTKSLPVQTNTQISQNEFDQHMMAAGATEAQKSSDWWRQVGAVIVKNNQVILQTHNQHVPNEQMPYVNGDPRGNFHKGEHIDLSTALHAEAGLIAQAARQGISLAGSSLYVTTFPCPNCAKLIAYSGIKKMFFREGYAMLDGEKILKNNGVEIVQIAAPPTI